MSEVVIDRQSRCVCVCCCCDFLVGLKFKPTTAKRNFEDVTKMYVECLQLLSVAERRLVQLQQQFSLSRRRRRLLALGLMLSCYWLY